MLTTHVTSGRTYGLMMDAATWEWFSGARSSPMSCSNAATIISMSAPSRMALVAVCNECW